MYVSLCANDHYNVERGNTSIKRRKQKNVKTHFRNTFGNRCNKSEIKQKSTTRQISFNSSTFLKKKNK